MTTSDEFYDAVDTIKAGGNDKNYVIYVNGDFSVSGSTANTFDLLSGIKVSVRGEYRTVGLSTSGNLLRIGSSQSLILRDIDLVGRDTNFTSLVYVNSGSLIMRGKASIMYDRASVSGNSATGNDGGVYIPYNNYTGSDPSGGTFTMRDNASVSGNRITSDTGSGGGVNIRYGTFIMRDNASVSGNSALNGGGVYCSGVFLIEGGMVYENTIFSSGSGTALYVDSQFGGSAQYGNFDANDTFIPADPQDPPLITRDDDIEVINGWLY